MCACVRARAVVCTDIPVVHCSVTRTGGSPKIGLLVGQSLYAADRKVLLRVHVFWDVTLCRWVNGFRRFGGSVRLNLLGQAVRKQNSSWKLFFRRQNLKFCLNFGRWSDRTVESFLLDRGLYQNPRTFGRPYKWLQQADSPTCFPLLWLAKFKNSKYKIRTKTFNKRSARWDKQKN